MLSVGDIERNPGPRYKFPYTVWAKPVTSVQLVSCPDQLPPCAKYSLDKRPVYSRALSAQSVENGRIPNVVE